MPVLLPQLRDTKRKRKRAATSEVPVEKALQALHNVFHKQLIAIVSKEIENKSKKKPSKKVSHRSADKKEESINKKLQELRECLNKADRVPRLSLAQADNELGAETGTTRRILSSKYPGTGEIRTLWKNYATTNFDDAVAKAKAKLEEERTEKEAASGSKEAAIEEEIEEEIDRIRICSISLSSIIREDLDDDAKRIFLNTVSITAEHATNYIEDFGAVVHATMLKYATTPLTLDPVSKTTVPGQEHEHANFHALNIISRELIRDPQALGPDFTIPVTPLPANVA
ncbi:hypothetical protein DFQ29_007940, partial [Apophysomyces sp. BC1021]